MKCIVALALLATATPAAADVVSASPNGFEVRETVPLVVKPELAFSSFASLPAWWDPAHTYSKDAANLSLNLAPGGCLCENFPDGGGIEHLHVTYVEPGKHIILTGALGPLLPMAANGVLDVQIKSSAGGSVLTLDYRVSGFYNGGADKIAPAVDGMLAGQMKRFRAYATARPKT
jgi:hypothetical protein